MRAARLNETTEDPAQAFELTDVPEPEIQTPNDVVVDVASAGWCRTDNKILDGTRSANLPITPGHETAGVVHAVGDAVTTVEPGDAVVCYPRITCGTCQFCREGLDTFCENSVTPGIHVDGGFAEYLRTFERSVVTLKTASPEEMAPVTDAGLTSYSAVKRTAHGFPAGGVVVVFGIGGLGHLAIQELQAMTPATIIAVDVKSDALELAEELGADVTVNPTETDLQERVRKVAGEHGVYRVLDFVGATGTVKDGMAMLRPDGQHVLVGYAEELQIPSSDFPLNQVSVVGSRLGSLTELRELVSLVENGDVTLHTETFDLDEINHVARITADGELTGRAILIP